MPLITSGLSKVAKMSPVNRFLYWIEERHRIHTRREQGWPKPWSNDPVMQTTFFTNPYRENDKVTRWFRESVRGPLKNDSAVLFATICFRWFNYIPTGKALVKHVLLTDWRDGFARKLLRQRADAGQVFTGAYMISGKIYTGLRKTDCVCNLLKPVWKGRKKLIQRFEDCDTMQEACEILKEFSGLGGFMAYEIACDLRYTYLLNKTTDRSTWCNPGPGCRRGLARLNETFEESRGRLPKDWQNQLCALLLTTRERLPHMPRFEMREIEHSLCEWDKYERARLGDGRIKRKYAGA